MESVSAWLVRLATLDSPSILNVYLAMPGKLQYLIMNMNWTDYKIRVRKLYPICYQLQAASDRPQFNVCTIPAVVWHANEQNSSELLSIVS